MSQDDRNGRFLIDEIQRDLEDLSSVVPRSRRMRLQKKYATYKAAFMQKEGTHPLIPREQSVLDNVIKSYKAHKDMHMVLQMVNAAYRNNTLPGHNADLQALRMKLMRKESLSAFDDRLIEKVIETS